MLLKDTTSNSTETSMTSNDLNGVKMFKTQVEPPEPQTGGFTAKWNPFAWQIAQPFTYI